MLIFLLFTEKMEQNYQKDMVHKYFRFKKNGYLKKQLVTIIYLGWSNNQEKSKTIELEIIENFDIKFI